MIRTTLKPYGSSREEIQKVIETLQKPHYREILTLRDVQRLSYKAIATVLGCPIGTVMSRLHVARRKLRKAMRAMGKRQ